MDATAKWQIRNLPCRARVGAQVRPREPCALTPAACQMAPFHESIKPTGIHYNV
jgi:hypothetical protein